MKLQRTQALLLAAAAVAGYAGAAAFNALALPGVPVATGFGPGDGLTRYLLTAEAGDATPDLLAGLEDVRGVVNAQRLHDGHALVATKGLTPAELAAVPGVAAVAPSTSVPVFGSVTDPYVATYGYNLVNTGSNAYQGPAVEDADTDAPDGWDATTGAGTVVAVVDTGYDSDHPDLSGALWTNPAETCGSVDRDGDGRAGDCHGWNFTTDSADIDNGSYGAHGTSVAGAVGARANNGIGTAGVAPDVQIMPLVIGSGESVDVVLAAEAIRYAVDHGADVINGSWGGAFSGWALDNLRSAIAYAAEHDVLVVVAAGNDAGNRDTAPLYPASLTEPNVVTVGNSTAADTITASSAYGATSVDLFAPGDLVCTTWNDGSFRLVGGTSIASPQVAAAYALYRAAMPTADFAQLRAALLGDVDPVPAFAGKSVTGGRLSLTALATGSGEQVRYAFTSMTSPAGEVTPAIGLSGPTGSGDYSVALGLGMEYAGEIWALSGKNVTLGGTTVPTDDAGDAVFPLGSRAGVDGLGLSPSMELGDGRYVLTVQLFRDGEPVGRMTAAPLLVGSAASSDEEPGGSDGDGSDGSTGDGSTGDGPDGSSGDGGGSGTPGDGGSGTPDPGAGGGLPVPPGDAGSPGTSGGSGGSSGGDSGSDSGSSGGDPDGGTPGGSGGSTPDGSGGSTPGSDSGSDTPGTSETPGSGGSTPGGTGGSTPGGSGGSTPGDGGSTTYPEVGLFRITSLSPTVVGTAGGTLVTITGEALPADPTVRIGSTTTADVVSASATRVVFRAPARTAGTYDVAVFAPDRRATVLSNALTYADAAPGGGGTGSGGTGSGGTGSGDGTPGDGGSGSEPGTGAGGSDPGDGSGSGDGSPGDGGSGSAGSTAPVVRSGPAGERLVRSAKFGALGSIWTMNCSSSCTGIAI